jgi:formylglycine-generating enzyme required for sulfatase activity
MKVFISYRRSDTPDVSGRIYDELAGHFGDQTVFKDVDDIPLGVNFASFLNDVVQQSGVMLIVIGSNWLEVTDERGGRRLDQPDDFVRIEVAAALERGIPIVPLLVQGASMPRQSELPDELAALSLYNGTQIRPDPDFHWDMGRLIRQLDPYVAAADDAAAGRAAGQPPAPADREAETQADPARLAALYTDAQSAYYTGQWGAAVDLLSEIVSLQEDYGRAAEMLEEARRQQTLSEQYALGGEAHAAGRWAEAVDHLQAVVALDADYKDAAAKLQEAKRQKELAELYADARRLHQAARWPAVIQVFEQIHGIEPGYADPHDLLASARAEAEAEARAKKLADLYAQGLAHVEAQAWPEAVQCFEQIAQIEPEYRETEALLARVQQEAASQEREGRLAELYERALEQIAAQEWLPAERTLRRIAQIEPEYRETEALRARARSEIATGTLSTQPADLPASQLAPGKPGAHLLARIGARSRPVWLRVVAGTLGVLLFGAIVLGVRSTLQRSAAQAATAATAMAAAGATATSAGATAAAGATATSAAKVVAAATSAARAAATSAARATPSPQVGATRVRPQDGAVMVYVPAGEFWMGSAEDDPDADDDEKPRHKVFVDGFWIDRTEVTNAQYRRCVEAGACRPHTDASSWSRESYYGNPEYDDYPVVWVGWSQARAYAEWAGGRLPTEAEWEYTARGPEGATYPWGEEPPDESLLNYGSNVGDTTEVGAYPEGASWVGALDMAGNVWEWTSSLYADYPYDPGDGREDPEAEGDRVLRGGAFNYHTLRGAERSFGTSGSVEVVGGVEGFRVVVSPG